MQTAERPQDGVSTSASGFRLAKRGYEPGEVEERLAKDKRRLDELTRQMETLQNQRSADARKIADLEARLARARESQSAEAVGRALVVAEQEAGRIERDARSTAANVVAAAQVEADAIRLDARTTATEIVEEANAIRDAQLGALEEECSAKRRELERLDSDLAATKQGIERWLSAMGERLSLPATGAPGSPQQKAASEADAVLEEPMAETPEPSPVLDDSCEVDAELLGSEVDLDLTPLSIDELLQGVEEAGNGESAGS